MDEKFRRYKQAEEMLRQWNCDMRPVMSQYVHHLISINVETAYRNAKKDYEESLKL